MNLKKLIFAGMLSSLLLGMTGCSTSKPAEQESSQAQTQETYEKVSSIDQLIELVKSKYTENSNEICLYTVRVPITVPGYDNDQLITRVVYTKQDGTITDKLLAADHSNFLSLKDPAISYDIDIKQERFLCDQFYDSHSVISLLENDVGGRETRNYYEPVILYNSFDQDVLKQYSLDVPKNLSIDESSKVLANIYEKGKLSTMEDFQFALSHAIVYWFDSNAHNEKKEYQVVDPTEESHNYRVYLEKVPLKKQELANNEILVYVEWDCPTTKQTETVVIYAPQDYVFLQDESLANAAFVGKSCTYLESYGQIKTDTCWSFYWDTEALFPLFLKQYDNNINQLHYYEPQKILEGTFEAGSYPEMNDCLT